MAKGIDGGRFPCEAGTVTVVGVSRSVPERAERMVRLYDGRNPNGIPSTRDSASDRRGTPSGTRRPSSQPGLPR